MLEEEEFVDTFLRCLICRELFDVSEKPPKILPCHHTLCLECILRIYRGEVEYRKDKTLGFIPRAVSVVCPKCRKNFITQEKGLRQLPTDHRVVQLIDFVKHTDIQTIQYCSKHKKQHLNFFCEYCCYLVCRDCTIIDHKESDGHIVLDIEAAIEKYTPVIEKAMDEIESQNVSLKEKRLVVEQAIENMDKAEEGLSDNIRKSFARLKTLLEEREKELLGMVESSVNNEKQKLKDKVGEIDTRSKGLDEKYQELQSVKQDRTVDKMFKAQEEAKSLKETTPITIEDVDVVVQAKFSFNDRDEKYLSNRIKNYGEVDTQIESRKPVTSSASTYGSSSHTKYGSSYGGASYNRYTSGSYGSSVYGGRNYYRP